MTNKLSHHRFYPSTAKALADKIIADELSDVKYDEDEAKTWSLNISDKIREAVTGKEHVNCGLLFVYRCIATMIVHDISIYAFLSICLFVADKLKKTRFKIVVQTTIGQMRDQGIRIASRCLWDPTTDNYASCSYTNVSRNCCFNSSVGK